VAISDVRRRAESSSFSPSPGAQKENDEADPVFPRNKHREDALANVSTLK
jgi:hypothetical protein